MNSSIKANSPIGLRENDSQETLETYHPNRILTRQARIESGSDALSRSNSNEQQEANNQRTALTKQQSGSHGWLPKSFMQSKLRNRLSKGIARLSSLDSTQSSSSVEMDSSTAAAVAAAAAASTPNFDQQGAPVGPTNMQANQQMPMISITPNEHGQQQQQQQRSHRQMMRARQQQYNNYYGRSRVGLRDEEDEDEDDYDEDDDDDDDDDDDFRDLEDPPLPTPYSSSAMSRSTIIRQQTNAGHPQHSIMPNKTTNLQNYEDLLDDRQGMNNSEFELHTKGEKMGRPSLDGSIASDFRVNGGGKKSGKSGSTKDGSGKDGGGGGSKGKRGKNQKDKNRGRSKSPSSSNIIRGRTGSSRNSKRGRFSRLAARLKLTRKHESIAKFQLSILNSGFVPLKTLDRDLQTFLPKERMTPKEFEKRVQLIRKYEVLASIEYRFASRYETYVCKHAQQESNQAKNNYKKCIPYDYNRVVLKTLPKVPDSDYINASHIDSCLKPNAYIAAQGPNENTIEDFWRMIWEQKTFVIVMLTKVFDFIRVMCNQYWPVELNKPERYGNLEITLLYEEPLADFVIRTIKITKLRASQQQQQKQQSSSENNNNNNAGNGGQMAKDDEQTNSSQDQRQKETDQLSSDYASSFDDDEVVIEDQQQPHWSGQVPLVRAPRFRAKPRSRTPEPAGPQHQTNLSTNSNNVAAARSSSQPPSEADLLSRRVGNPEFLHPLSSTSFHQGNHRLSAASSQSIPSTPATPRTPSSAGLDRSSATRRAVKKKRRERVKNKRPMRTQFQVPDESQLVDDDDDDYLDNDGGIDDATLEAEGRQANERIIYQFHYNAWASHTCPFISSLLHFRRRVRICMDEMSKSGKTGPTVVHCNDGCGRTGTYLCIDANLELAEEDNVYDVYNYTRKMRQSRKFLIENLEQFKFVYDTIEEAMFCGKTWFPVSELHKRLKHKSQRNPLTKKNEYQREYGRICRMTSKFSIGDCAGGHRVENREKNRDVSTVPPDNFRPYLTSFQTNDSTDYINAVFVDGYTRSKEYIVTEWPLHKTISDFWSLIYDHDCNSVILLANPGESSTYPSFLPSEKELRRKFGPVFSAEMVSYTHYQNIKSWIYTINKKIVSLTEVIAGVKSEAKTTQVFQITCWPQGHRVPTSTNALVELMNMVERWRQRTAYGPVCVVSLNGKSRAGVYCAANVAIEQVVQHSEVDVFQAVKTVRRHRPQLIENMTEYKYCYDLILHYVLHYVNQSPANQ